MDRGSVALDLGAPHQLLYEALSREWPRWLGVPMLKNPLDLAIYAEIVHEVRPRLIVETGTAFGGSALYWAHLCDAIGQGRVISIDLRLRERVGRYWVRIGEILAQPGGLRWSRPQHPRLTYLTGSSTDPEIVSRVTADAAACGGPVLVALDADHHAAHVRAECESYGPLVTPGSYLIVEDTNMNGRPIPWGEGPGPAEAAEGFLAEHPEFMADRTRERFGVTFNPGGYLRRVA